MTHTIRRAAALALVLSGLPGLRTDALAQQGWLPNTSFLSFGNQDAEYHRLAFDGAGNAVAVWERYDAPTPVIQVANYSAALGAWRIPYDISPPTQVSLAPDVAIDAQGNVIAVWLRYDGVVYVLQAARGTATGEAWSAPVNVATVGAGAMRPVVKVTPTGDAMVIWTALVGINASVHAARYSVGTGMWSPAVRISTAGEDAYLADLDLDPDGDAVAVWTRYDGTDEIIDSARYTVATDTWSAATPLSAGSAFTEYAHVALDAAGDAVAVWNRQGTIETSRYSTAGSSWSPAASLSLPDVALEEPQLTIDGDGNVVAVWRVSAAVQVARYSSSGGAWSSALSLSAPGQPGYEPRVAVDPAGNAMVLWRAWNGAHYVLQSARYVRATAIWGSVMPVSDATHSAYAPEIVADPRGNFAAIWDGWDGQHDTVRTKRWEGTPTAPGIVSITPVTGGIAVHFTAPLAIEPAFAATGYEYSISTRPWVPAGTTSPLVITGLPAGAYQVALRAVNAAGAGAQMSAPFAVNPNPPTGLVATAVSGHTVTLNWLAPLDVPPGSTYVIEGGVAPGQTLAAIPTGSAATGLTFTAPTGAFFVRVRTDYFQLRSSPSNEIQIFVNVAAPPSAPADLLGLINGPALALSWTNTYGGGAPTGLQLHVSGTINGVLPLGLTETFAVPVVPPGVYTVRLAATNASGVSGLSNPVALTVPGACSGVPGVPTRVVATRTGSAIRVAWSPPTTGAAVSAYWLIVGGSFVGAFPTTARTLAGTVGPGTYSFAVVAVNACGPGAQSLPETVVVP